jgi:hypothetical protein
MALDDLALLLPRQRVEDGTQLPPRLAEDGLPASFAHEHDTILAVPFGMGWALISFRHLRRYLVVHQAAWRGFHFSERSILFAPHWSNQWLTGFSYFRAVAQVGANGAIQVTPANADSGNNGRAAILANGLYYMGGNGIDTVYQVGNAGSVGNSARHSTSGGALESTTAVLVPPISTPAQTASLTSIALLRLLENATSCK